MPSIRFGLLTLLVLAALPRTVRAEDVRSLPLKSTARIDEIVQAAMAKQEVVGMAVGIVHDGRLAYLKGYGLADREQRKQVTTQTIFNWASNSKPVAAVAAMQLAEQGKLDLDADIRKYVPEFPEKKGAVITTRQLLCHQSGIPHYKNGVVIPTKRDGLTTASWLNPVVGLSKFDRSPLLYAPGEKTTYSSYAYVLLSAVIQGAGKKPFIEQIETRIVKPLKMNSFELDMPMADQPNWTVGYEKGYDGKVQVTKDEAHYWKHGAGGFKSNIGDFARWAKGLLDHRLVSAETEKQMWTPQTTSDGKPSEYGLGFRLKEQGGLQVSHGGKQDETTTHLILFPAERLGIVVMCNCDFGKPAKVADAIAKLMRNSNEP